MEIFKDIPGYEGKYQVSNLGNVKSFMKYKDGKILKQRTDEYGYKDVELCVNYNKKRMKIHRIMLLSFVGLSDLQVNHKDGIKNNNFLGNLEYCTAKENIHHSQNILGNIKGRFTRENNPRKKLSTFTS